MIALAFGDDEGDVLEGGPLADPSNSSATGAPVELNLPYSWGGTSLINEGDEAVTIERVELLELPAGMRVLGMYAARRARSGDGGTASWAAKAFHDPILRYAPRDANDYGARHVVRTDWWT